MSAIFTKGRRLPKKPFHARFAERYRWVHEILEHKVDDLPFLITMEIKEAIKERCGPLYDYIDQHDLPNDLQHAAAMAELNLSLFLRRPREHPGIS